MKVIEGRPVEFARAVRYPVSSYLAPRPSPAAGTRARDFCRESEKRARVSVTFARVGEIAIVERSNLERGRRHRAIPYGPPLSVSLPRKPSAIVRV